MPKLVAFYAKLNEIHKNEFHFALEVSFSIIPSQSMTDPTTIVCRKRVLFEILENGMKTFGED